jgi:Tol biopolymer transport system component
VIAGALFFGLRGLPGAQTAETTQVGETAESTEIVEETPAPEPTLTAASPEGPVSPGVPPTGAERLGLCQWDGYGDGICIASEMGSNEPKAQILEDSDLEMGNPSWSYDGTQIIFSATAPGDNPGEDTKMYIVNRDGSGLTQLDGIGNDVEPNWGPDDWLAFHSNGKLAIMKVDGTEKQYIFDPRNVFGTSSSYCVSNPAWSYDGEWIVFAVPEQCGNDTMPQERQLWVVSQDGSQSWMLFTDSYQDMNSYFSEYAFDPAGGRIAFYDAEMTPLIINVAEGSTPSPLTTFPNWWVDYTYPHSDEQPEG